jgi:hypothetical protein
MEYSAGKRCPQMVCSEGILTSLENEVVLIRQSIEG